MFTDGCIFVVSVLDGMATTWTIYSVCQYQSYGYTARFAIMPPNLPTDRSMWKNNRLNFHVGTRQRKERRSWTHQPFFLSLCDHFFPLCECIPIWPHNLSWMEESERLRSSFHYANHSSSTLSSRSHFSDEGYYSDEKPSLSSVDTEDPDHDNKQHDREIPILKSTRTM